MAAGHTKLRWRLSGLLSERQGCTDEAERLLEKKLPPGTWMPGSALLNC